MQSVTTKILVEGQVVVLDLGGRTQALTCRVLGFGGSTVVLAPVSPPSGSTAEALAPDATAYVIVDDDGQIHALRARVGSASDGAEIVVTVTDAFQLGQRRRYSRAPLVLAARMRAPASGDEWETVTRDISAGGLRVARTDAPGEASDVLEIVLEAPQAGLRIAAGAEVVRRTPIDVSLRFTRIEPQDATLLLQLAVAYYRLI